MVAVRDEDEARDQVEHDPRWEVQPELDPDDDQGSDPRAVLIAAVMVTVLVLLAAWLLADAPPTV